MYVCVHACMYVYIYPSISSMFLGVKILVQRGAKTIIKALLTEYCLCKVYFRPGVHLFKTTQPQKTIPVWHSGKGSHTVQFRTAQQVMQCLSNHCILLKRNTRQFQQLQEGLKHMLCFLSRLILACTRLSMSKANIIHSVGVAAQEDNDRSSNFTFSSIWSYILYIKMIKNVPLSL